MTMHEFHQRVVVVTGASGNLGRAVAQAFARHGAHLAFAVGGQQVAAHVVGEAHRPDRGEDPVLLGQGVGQAPRALPRLIQLPQVDTLNIL